MHKSTRYGYSVQKHYFERFFTVRSTTRTTNFPDIDHRQKTTQPSRKDFLAAIPRLEAPYFHIAVRNNDWGNRLLQFYCVNRSILLYSREICCRSFRHHRHHPSEPHRRPFTRFTRTCTRRAGRRARARGGGLPGAVAINK